MESSLDIAAFLQEDRATNDFYRARLPQKEVTAKLYIKSPLYLSGLLFVAQVFAGESAEEFEVLREKYEGKFVPEGTVIELPRLPLALAISRERLALNLLSLSSSITTHCRRFLEKLDSGEIALLDTRKTLPGLRSLQKYAVAVAGAYNHRFQQSDVFMIKDNHKNIWGGLKEAYQFFKETHSFYTPLVAEIHSLQELQEAIALGIRHVMLDNFTPEEVQKALKIKPSTMTYEVSGGITLENISHYALAGVDAISVGSLFTPPPVDISLKFTVQ